MLAGTQTRSKVYLLPETVDIHNLRLIVIASMNFTTLLGIIQR